MDITTRHPSSNLQSNSQLSKPDIVDVASQFTRLRRSGKGLTGLCPIHGERTPSFYVDPTKQYFKCFGCQEHGDVITLVQKVKALSFKEALDYLNIETPKRKPRKGRPRIKVLLDELKGLELEALYRELLRLHSYLCANWMRMYNRQIASKYDFWYDDPDLIAEHLPELLRQCADADEAKHVMWWIETVKEWRHDLEIIHGGTNQEKFDLYREITGGDNGNE